MFMNPMATLWLVLLILFLMAEGATAAVTTIWFAAGALVAMVAALLDAQIWLQVIVFVVVSIGCLLALRPLLKKYITPKKVRTNVDAVVGSQGVVLERIDNLAGTGRVKLGGMEWSARAENNECIEAGTVVRVEKIEGVKVFVTPVAVPAK
jgi:membrane protein implicated in regulation of membrane protease activity